MTLEEAQSAFHQERDRAVDDLRKPLEQAVARAERGVFVPVVRRPKGLFWRILIRDYERFRDDSRARFAALELALKKLYEFDALVRDRQSPLQGDINARTRQRCEAADSAILDTLRREQARKDEAKQLAVAVSEFNRATGEKHELVLPETLNGKCPGTLVDAVELNGQLFARVTNDRGYSYELFPWQSGMEAHIGRPCWFWYDGRGKVKVGAQVAARPALTTPSLRIGA